MTIATAARGSLAGAETLINQLRARQRQVPVTGVLMAVNLSVPCHDRFRRRTLALAQRRSIGLGRATSVRPLRTTNGGDLAQLAIHLDTDVAERYERSFYQLSRLPLRPELPSAAVISLLRGYANTRREELHVLAEGIRSGDPKHIDKARELGKQAAELGR